MDAEEDVQQTGDVEEPVNEDDLDAEGGEGADELAELEAQLYGRDGAAADGTAEVGRLLAVERGSPSRSALFRDAASSPSCDSDHHCRGCNTTPAPTRTGRHLCTSTAHVKEPNEEAGQSGKVGLGMHEQRRCMACRPCEIHAHVPCVCNNTLSLAANWACMGMRMGHCSAHSHKGAVHRASVP